MIGKISRINNRFFELISLPNEYGTLASVHSNDIGIIVGMYGYSAMLINNQIVHVGPAMLKNL